MNRRWENETETLFVCPIFKLRRVSATIRDIKSHYFLLENPNWVNIIPLTREGNIIMIRQFRIGANDWTLEIPGGIIEANESPLEAALRELQEETGYGRGEAHYLGKVEPNPATHSNWCHSFLIKDVELVGDINLDDGEEIEIKEVSLEKIPDMIRHGEISHSMVLNAFFLYQLRQSERGNPEPWVQVLF